MSETNRRGNLFKAGIRLKMLCLCVLIVALVGAAPAFGLWMPWASETDKIKKTVKDVWFALLRDDRKSVEKLLTGPAAATFVDQEMKIIRDLAVTDYGFRFNRVTVDPLKGEWAWVELEKLAILKNGSSKPMKGLSTFRKLKGEWKLYVGTKKRKNRAARTEEKEGRSSGTPDRGSRNRGMSSP